MEYTLITMSGAGNRFLVADERAMFTQDVTNLLQKKYSAAAIRQLSAPDNPATKGCDQFLILSNTQHADCFMHIINADGSTVDACGNATRAVGLFLMHEHGRSEATIHTNATANHSPLTIRHHALGAEVDMGSPQFEWQQIPLAKPYDTSSLPIKTGALASPTAISMGNPHMVFFVSDVEAIDFQKDNLGEALVHHPLYPEGANIGAAQLLDRQTIKLRVYERGAGETLACGTGACAALAAAVRHNLTDRHVTIQTRGGNLALRWEEENNHIYLAGAVDIGKTIHINLS